ncbi:hypothetical protein RHSIM_Rhsim12G0172400 [Rhododendron simsii]|uniref:Uncharacterized protein n=1 Tax=Rhododendron simsii TaxID=118357 RepID=A0A834L828_RHOSS|nr:hypothetical protein RHSIM_Rhsim12G0172400 [Rhododendron simsii]
MATSAFKSTTSRTPIGASPTSDVSGSSASSATKAHRRSRSLSRFSRRVLEPDSDPGQTPAPPESKGKFVNKVRGSGFGDISLDDLAIEFFSLKDERESERGRSSSRRGAGVASRVAAPTESSERRGRSVSRQRSGGGGGKSGSLGGGGGGGGGGRIGSDASSRRRRSVSVVRCQISDSESDIDHPRNSINHGSAKRITGGNSQMPSLQKPTALCHRQLGRSLSQKDLSKNGYSSQSSALTDDEAKETCSGKNTIEKTIRAVYAQKKGEHPTGDDVTGGLYEAMRKELRYAVDEIKMELEHARVRTTSTLESESFLQSDNSNDRQAASKVRKSCTTKQEQSEKRNQDVVAEIVLEKLHGRELPKIVRGLLPGPKSSTIAEKSSRPRKRSNDRNRLSKRLSEEAEIYFEDFISNVEDTDFSSFDGERSDTSSTLGVTKTRDAVFQTGETETFQSPAGSNSRPDEMDGVNLPWLQWETSPSKEKRVLPVTPKSIVWDAAQELVSAQDPSGHSTGSWSPGLDSASSSTRGGTGSILKEVESHQRSEFDMDRYLNLKQEEDLLFERWRERNHISSGGLLLCSNIFI